MGNKILRQRLKGPALAAYYPRKLVTIRDLQKAYEPYELFVDDEVEDDRLEHIAGFVQLFEVLLRRYRSDILQLESARQGCTKEEEGWPRYVSRRCGRLAPSSADFIRQQRPRRSRRNKTLHSECFDRRRSIVPYGVRNRIYPDYLSLHLPCHYSWPTILEFVSRKQSILYNISQAQPLICLAGTALPAMAIVRNLKCYKFKYWWLIACGKIVPFNDCRLSLVSSFRCCWLLAAFHPLVIFLTVTLLFAALLRFRWLRLILTRLPIAIGANLIGEKWLGSMFGRGRKPQAAGQKKSQRRLSRHYCLPAPSNLRSWRSAIKSCDPQLVSCWKGIEKDVTWACHF